LELEKEDIMKKFGIFACLTALFLFIGAGLGNTSTAYAASDEYDKITLKLSTSGTDLGVDSLAAKKFGELLEEASGGRVKVRVFPNAQLAGGSMPKNISLLAQGGPFEMAVLSATVLGNLDEKFLTVGVPFTFANYAEVNERIDGTGGKWLKEMLDPKGIVYLSGMHNGLKQITNGKREIKTPDDLKGLKIRIPGGEVGIRTFKEFGADPVAMSWSEVFTALQQGTVDGQENSYQTIDSGKVFEVQKYLTQWNYSYDGYFFLINKKDWGKLSEPTQKLIEEKAIEAALWGRKYLEDGELAIKKKFQDSGMTITELSKEELQVFIDKVKPVQEYFIDKFGADACAAWGLEKQ
jgi:C4-dicarboxylate transporter DctM subunit